MCGRFASFRDAQDLSDEFAIAEIAHDARLLPPSWNVAPTDPVRIVTERADPTTGTVGRSLRVARWGLVPSWSKDPRGGSRMINARAETLSQKRAFSAPLATRRCLVPADGYYEWQALGPGTRGGKQPYFISGTEEAAFAGLYEFWRDPERAEGDPSRWLVTTTIITRQAVPELASIHDRMPLALPPTAWDEWLDPATDAKGATALLATAPIAMEARPVSRMVGSVANNGPELILPVTNEVQPL